MRNKKNEFRPVYEVDASAYVKVPTYIIGQLIVEHGYTWGRVISTLRGLRQPTHEEALLLEPYRVQRGVKVKGDALRRCKEIVSNTPYLRSKKRNEEAKKNAETKD